MHALNTWVGGDIVADFGIVVSAAVGVVIGGAAAVGGIGVDAVGGVVGVAAVSGGVAAAAVGDGYGRVVFVTCCFCY